MLLEYRRPVDRTKQLSAAYFYRFVMARILHVMKAQHIAGAESYVFELLPRLIQHGFDVGILNLYDASKKPASAQYEKSLSELEKTGVRVYRATVRHKLDPTPISAIKRIIQKTQPDLLHTHMPYADLFGALAAHWAGGVPVLSSRHHDYSSSWKEWIQFVAYYGVAGRFIDTLIAVSAKVASLATSYEGWLPSDISIVHHGCRDERKDRTAALAKLRRELDIPKQAFIVATVARLIRLKGHRYAIKSLRYLIEQGHAVHWLFIGDGPEKELLEAQAKDAGVDRNLHLMGYRSDVPELLSAVDLMVHPSTGEAFGMVLIEAMVQGTPVVASRAGAIPEIVLDGQTGRVVPPRDAKAMAEAVEELLEATETRREMGKRARSRYLANFTPEMMARSTVKVYRKLLRMTP